MGRFSRFKATWSRKPKEESDEVVCVSYRANTEIDKPVTIISHQSNGEAIQPNNRAQYEVTREERRNSESQSSDSSKTEWDPDVIFKRVSIVSLLKKPPIKDPDEEDEPNKTNEDTKESNKVVQKPEEQNETKLKGILRKPTLPEVDGFEIIDLPSTSELQFNEPEKKRSVTYKEALEAYLPHEPLPDQKEEKQKTINVGAEEECDEGGYSSQAASIFFDEEEPEIEQIRIPSYETSSKF